MSAQNTLSRREALSLLGVTTGSVVHAALNRRLDPIPNFGGAIELTRIDRGWPIPFRRFAGDLA
jgi:hypothetical protein